jgi:hypothetical protein
MAVPTPPSGKEWLNKMPAPPKNEANSLIVKMGPAKNKSPTVDCRRAFEIRKTTFIAAPL